MSKIFKLLLAVFLIAFVVAETSGICKWVDENGVAHYAETCPEDADTTDIRIHAPPTMKQIEATTQRSEKLQEESQVRADRRAEEKTQKAQEKSKLEETRDSATEKCAEARWNLSILNMQLPVYFDDESLLHFNRSLHDYYYSGQRTYLDDQQRQAEISHYSRVEAETCTASEADIRARIRKYNDRSRKEICGHLRNKLENMQMLSTGIPSDQMRDLQKQIESRCN